MTWFIILCYLLLCLYVQTDDITEWLRREGSTIHNFIQIYNFNDEFGKGIIVMTDLYENTTILSIPIVPQHSTLSVFMTPYSVQNSIHRLLFSCSPDVAKINDIIASISNIKEPINIVVIGMIIERYIQTSSFWKPYFGVLPQNFNNFSTSITYTNSQLDRLKPSPLYEKVMIWNHKVKSFYDNSVKAILEAIISLCHINYEPNYEHYLWSVNVVYSRAFLIHDPLIKEKVPAMCPYIDSMNSGESNVVLRSDENGYFKVITSRNINNREQLFISYGELSNYDLMIYYGYCLLKNPYDVLVVDVSSVIRHIIQEDNDKKKLLVLTNLHEIDCTIELFENISISDYDRNVISILRITVLDRTEMNYLYTLENDKIQEIVKKKISDRNESQLILLLINHFKSLLDQYYNTEIFQKNTNLRDKCIFNVKEHEKAILEQAIKTLEQDESYNFLDEKS